MAVSNKWVIGNWKMNPARPAEVAAFFQHAALQELTLPAHVRLAIAPSHLHLSLVRQLIDERQVPGQLMAQDCAVTPATGACTGEISASQLHALGVDGAIIGHSERRRDQHESDGHVAQKLSRLLEQNLLAILCVGETLEERQAGQAATVVCSQLACLGNNPLLNSPSGNLVIAYEPVWAIGTGVAASVADAGEMHRTIRNFLAGLSPALADTPILYGGSVKPENAADLLADPSIDGFLVGGASLLPDSFVQIVQTVCQHG